MVSRVKATVRRRPALLQCSVIARESCVSHAVSAAYRLHEGNAE
jgi:hypothetical protein